jgi:hypothetical protein
MRLKNKYIVPCCNTLSAGLRLTEGLWAFVCVAGGNLSLEPKWSSATVFGRASSVDILYSKAVAAIELCYILSGVYSLVYAEVGAPDPPRSAGHVDEDILRP